MKDSRSRSFLGSLGLDGDGWDEVITEVIGYEDNFHEIWKRVGGSWLTILEGGGHGC